MKGFILRALLAWTLLACTCGQVFAGLSERINAVIGRKDYAKADFTVKVVKADTCQTVYSRNSGKLMIPASNMKIITTAAAMAYLGKNYNFTTKVAVLNDDLVIIGGGDPLLGDTENDRAHGKTDGWIFADIIDALRETGRSAVNDIVVDSTFFDDMRVHPSWPAAQLNQPYACEVSGLNYNNNCLHLTVRRSGNAAIIIVEPQTGYLSFVNKVKLVSSGSSAVGAYRNNTPNLLTVSGKCNKEAGFDLAVENPAMMFATMLKESLERAGITVSGSLVEKHQALEEAIQILRTYQTPISEVVTRCNKDSLNMGAESLVKTISAEYSTGRIGGQWTHGLQMVSRYLTKLDISPDEFKLGDGCGLSRDNLVSANAIVGVLCNIYNSDGWEDYKKSLAVGGVDGTIYKYFHDQKYKGRIIGKTGYINAVRTFSGVAQTDSGDYIFSILTAGGSASVRTGINDIAQAIIDSY